MSFVDCIKQKIDAKEIEQKRGDDLIKRFENLVAKNQQTNKGELAARLLDIDQKAIDQRQVNDIRFIMKMVEMQEKLADPKTSVKTLRDIYERTYIASQRVFKQILRDADEFVEKYKSTLAGLRQDHDGVVRVVREMLGQSTGDTEASIMARGLRTAVDNAAERFRRNGGVLGEIKNYFPQSHNRELIRQVTYKEWRDYIWDRIDRDKMVDFDTGEGFGDEALEEIMKDIYQDIITNGNHSLMKKARAGKDRSPHSLEVSYHRERSRFFHFKDADSFLEYNEKFGVGNSGLFDAITGHLKSFSRDIALLENLGPKPNTLHRNLEMFLEGQGHENRRLFGVSGVYDVISGYVDQVGDDTNHVLRAVGTTQNYLRHVLLGSAIISAISDIPVLFSTVRSNGLPGFSVINHFFKTLNPLDKASRQQAINAGYITEHALSGSMQGVRWGGEEFGGKVSSFLASLTVRASGLATWTKMIADSASLGLESQVQQFKKVPFDQLPDVFRKSAESHGITAKEWSMLSGVMDRVDREAKFIGSREIASLGTEEALELANKIDDWSFTLRSLSTNEPTAAVRSITTGAAVFKDARKFTAGRALMSSATMFKSFPITFAMNHLIPALRKAKNGSPEQLATIAIGMTLLAAIPLQVKQLRDGKSPMDMNNRNFWMAAMLQGGGLGIFGDFLFQDTSRFGHSLSTTLTGPLGGLASDVWDSTQGNLLKLAKGEDTDFSKDMVRMTSRYAPITNLWYSKLAVERLIFNQFEQLVDPKFNQRKRRLENRIQKEFGQDYWWEKGEVLPDAP